ncbi:MAG: hypothetical protein GPJ22_07845 [Microcystis aeruginosa LL13-03]|nr:hypothetical protein [Microcystis aeruginosa LL13-03]
MIENRQFLTPEESADVDAALLTAPEKFLTRLTISSLRLLKIIAEDTGVTLEELTHKQVIQWLEKDSKLRREQGIEAAVNQQPAAQISVDVANKIVTVETTASRAEIAQWISEVGHTVESGSEG